MKTIINLNQTYNNLGDFIAGLPSVFDTAGQTLYCGRNEIKSIITPDGTHLVAKRFGRLSALRRLIYSSVSRSKARRAFDNGKRFIELGFDTPTPVAYIEMYKYGILSDAYFISLRSAGKPLFVPLVEAERYDSDLADRVAHLMAGLHEQGAMHGDPNLNNILYDISDDGAVTLTLIDTNRSRFRRKLSTRLCLKNLMRVTHRRDLMRHIAGRYATLRGLDPVATVNRIFTLLARFERNRTLRHRVKNIFCHRSPD